MTDHESNMLDSSLIWDQDGHLSEIAQNAIVDAESALLPRAACEHAERCDTCMRSIGQLAQMSLEIDAALRQMDAGYLPQRAVHRGDRRGLRPLRHWPLAELGLGLVLALLGQLPTLQTLHPAGVRDALKALIQVGAQLLQQIAGGSLGAALPWVATSLLVAGSAGIAYTARRGLAHSLVNQSSSARSRLR